MRILITVLLLSIGSSASAPVMGPEVLARSIVDGLERGDQALLDSLLIKRAEFEQDIFPRFPAAKPGSGVGSSEVWLMHDRGSHKGLRSAINRWEGKHLVFKGVGFNRTEDYTDFRLRRGTIIHATDENGSLIEIRSAGSFVEKNGKWKLLSYRDR